MSDRPQLSSELLSEESKRIFCSVKASIEAKYAAAAEDHSERMTPYEGEIEE